MTKDNLTIPVRRDDAAIVFCEDGTTLLVVNEEKDNISESDLYAIGIASLFNKDEAWKEHVLQYVYDLVREIDD